MIKQKTNWIFIAIFSIFIFHSKLLPAQELITPAKHLGIFGVTGNVGLSHLQIHEKDGFLEQAGGNQGTLGFSILLGVRLDKTNPFYQTSSPIQAIFYGKTGGTYFTKSQSSLYFLLLGIETDFFFTSQRRVAFTLSAETGIGFWDAPTWYPQPKNTWPTKEFFIPPGQRAAYLFQAGPGVVVNLQKTPRSSQFFANYLASVGPFSQDGNWQMMSTGFTFQAGIRRTF